VPKRTITAALPYGVQSALGLTKPNAAEGMYPIYVVLVSTAPKAFEDFETSSDIQWPHTRGRKHLRTNSLPTYAI
jgi:hypothetical protein